MSDQSRNPDVRRAIGFINEHISKAQMEGLDQMMRALYQIVHLRWWERWMAKDIANRALGTGWYWDAEQNSRKRLALKYAFDPFWLLLIVPATVAATVLIMNLF